MISTFLYFTTPILRMLPCMSCKLILVDCSSSSQRNPFPTCLNDPLSNNIRRLHEYINLIAYTSCFKHVKVCKALLKEDI